MTEAGRDISEIEIIISPYENDVSLDDLRAYHELEFMNLFERLPGDDRMIPKVIEDLARLRVEPAAQLRWPIVITTVGFSRRLRLHRGAA